MPTITGGFGGAEDLVRYNTVVSLGNTLPLALQSALILAGVFSLLRKNEHP